MLNLDWLLEELSIGDELAVFRPEEGADRVWPAEGDLSFLVEKSEGDDIMNYLLPSHLLAGFISRQHLWRGLDGL